MQNPFCVMPSVQKHVIGGRWEVLVGLLLTLGLLAQSASVQPCSRTVLDGAGTERIVSSSAPAACSASTTTAVRQAVSSERPLPSVEGGLERASVEEWAVGRAVGVAHRDEARVRISPTLQILRPVVLQI